jgi:heterodisulfide reductase subunit C
LKLVGCEDGVWRCHTIFNCADACPKSINPTHFIQYLKRRATVYPPEKRERRRHRIAVDALELIRKAGLRGR